MARQISVCIYGESGNDWNNRTGTYCGFPVDAIVLIPLGPGQVMSTVTMKSKIKVLNNNNTYSTSPEFFTDRTVDSLITASNV